MERVLTENPSSKFKKMEKLCEIIKEKHVMEHAKLLREAKQSGNDANEEVEGVEEDQD